MLGKSRSGVSPLGVERRWLHIGTGFRPGNIESYRSMGKGKRRGEIGRQSRLVGQLESGGSSNMGGTDDPDELEVQSEEAKESLRETLGK